MTGRRRDGLRNERVNTRDFVCKHIYTVVVVLYNRKRMTFVSMQNFYKNLMSPLLSYGTGIYKHRKLAKT